MEILRTRNILLLLVFSILAIAVMGYHPGAEDDTVYVTAVYSDLNPALYPHDADFFKVELQASAFDQVMAEFVRVTGIPVAWSELLWQFASIFLFLLASWLILCRLFDDAPARWAGIAMLSAMLTLPVAGTALYIVDQYLHPRVIASALILLGVERIMAARRWQAIPLLAVSFLLHPIMGALGISFCCVLTITLFEPLQVRLREWRTRALPETSTPVAAMLPIGWLFQSPSKLWLEAIATRHWFRLYRWTWYEWLGAIGPLVIFWVVARVARKQGDTALAQFSTAIFAYGVFQQIVAMVLLGPRQLIVLGALEPMRYLHLVYVFLALIGGAYLGRYVLRREVWRWAVFLLLANGVMFAAQRQLFASTEHIELPGAASANPWIQAFTWIRGNTPTDAYFALDPYYMEAPHEDYHSFRAIAQRSELADAIKDTAILTKVPELGPRWEREVNAQKGWQHFQLADFERLKREFGVNWVLVSYPQPAGLDCRWHNGLLSVCQVP
ncbi:MAG TPA: hypothetical protein VG893_03150 [Terracidiphilus sp.]|nr:hypothetical protein [Terracidiphilus sp.]